MAKTGKQLDAEIAEALASDDDPLPTATEIAAAIGKVTDLAVYLRHNAIGWDAEGEKAEARKYRKLADKLEAAIAARDLTALRKLTKAEFLMAEERISADALAPLHWWARR